MQDHRSGLRLGLKDLPTSGACACITENGGKKELIFLHFQSVGTKQHILMNASIKPICSAILQTQISDTSSGAN